MKRIVRLTESDLTRIVRRVLSEGGKPTGGIDYLVDPRFFRSQAGATVLAVTSVTWAGPKVTCKGILFSRNSDGTYENEGPDTTVMSTTGRAKPNEFFGEDGQNYVSQVGGKLSNDVKAKFPITKQNSEAYFQIP
jgi:hypothetical protein